MPWILVSSLASSIVSFVVSNLTTKQPTVNVYEGEQTSHRELSLYKVGFWGLVAVGLVWAWKGRK